MLIITYYPEGDKLYYRFDIIIINDKKILYFVIYNLYRCYLF